MTTKLLGHPIHQMLIVFPLGLLATAVVFDVIGLVNDNPAWHLVAFYMIGAGVISGVIAALFGWLDYAGIPFGTRAKRVGLVHGLGNGLVLLLFAASWIMRSRIPGEPTMPTLVCSFLGAAISFVTGWLGGELVDRLGVGVDEGANPNAPSSLESHSAVRRPTAS